MMVSITEKGASLPYNILYFGFDGKMMLYRCLVSVLVVNITEAASFIYSAVGS